MKFMSVIVVNVLNVCVVLFFQDSRVFYKKKKQRLLSMNSSLLGSNIELKKF